MDEGRDYSTAALVLGIVAGVSFLIALFLTRAPLTFLLVSLVTGVTAVVLGAISRRNATATTGMVLGQTAAAGTLFLIIVYAVAAIVFLALLFLLWLLTYTPPYYSSSACNVDCSPTCGPCCVSSGSSSSGSCCGSPSGGCCGGSSSGSSGSCCGGSSSSSGSSGSCCGGGGSSSSSSGSSGSCCGGSSSGSSGSGSTGGGSSSGGGCCSSQGLAHHPDAPAYAADVYVVRGARYCIGCFTTYPTMLAATAALAFVPTPAFALPLGAAMASAQVLSSAGLAKTRWMKASVKASLGVGLALVIFGVRATQWAPQVKALALAGVAALAMASAIPRARRMRAAAAASRCECATTMAQRSGPTP